MPETGYNTITVLLKVKGKEQGVLGQLKVENVVM